MRTMRLCFVPRFLVLLTALLPYIAQSAPCANDAECGGSWFCNANGVCDYCDECGVCWAGKGGIGESVCCKGADPSDDAACGRARTCMMAGCVEVTCSGNQGCEVTGSAEAGNSGGSGGSGSGSSSDKLSGSVQSPVDKYMSVSLAVDGKNLEITMKGPSDSWFGFGFGSSMMQGTYAIIAHSGGITEHLLDQMDEHQKDSGLPKAMITVQSDNMYGQQREIVMTRSSTTMNDMFTTAGDLDIISAKSWGGGLDLSYHGPSNMGSSVLRLSESADSGSSSGSGRGSGGGSSNRGGGSSGGSRGGGSTKGGGGRGGGQRQ